MNGNPNLNEAIQSASSSACARTESIEVRLIEGRLREDRRLSKDKNE